MICKLFLEEGDYLDITTKEPRNMVCAEVVYAPSGEGDDWIGGFQTIEDAMNHFNIELKPIPEEHIGLDPLQIYQLNNPI
jgi:hypothetical protein